MAVSRTMMTDEQRKSVALEYLKSWAVFERQSVMKGSLKAPL